jgi:signal transduction histidine kinase
VAASIFAVVLLGGAFVRGRREAKGFVGMTLLAVALVYDALRAVGWAPGPPVASFGYAAFVNGIIMTLLARFAALRGQLEGRARELKDRARDLSRAYDELRAAQDEMVRKEQLAAVGELSAVVAHEVRNPLAIISNAVATLRRSGIGDEDRATLLGILDEESSRLNRLVGDLLRYARPVSLERQLVSLRDLVGRGMALAEGKLDLTAELVETEPTEKIWADPNLLRQVIDNLISNAIQAMSSGGVLTVTLVNMENEGVKGVEIQIQDTGEGMDTQVRKRALDPFFTTRPSGTGLGLAIVARIVDAHGGALRIKSKAGAGTVMHVFLPISADGAPRPRTSDPGRPSSEPPLPAELRRAIASSRKG